MERTSRNHLEVNVGETDTGHSFISGLNVIYIPCSSHIWLEAGSRRNFWMSGELLNYVTDYIQFDWRLSPEKIGYRLQFSARTND